MGQGECGKALLVKVGYDCTIKSNGVSMRRSVVFLLLSLVLGAEGITVPAGFSATFVQKVTTPKKKTVRYKGNVQVNRDRRFRWVYTAPASREICGDGKRVRIVDHPLEQVIVYRVGSLVDLMQLLKRAKPHHDRIYTAEYHGVNYTLKLDRQGHIEQVAYTDDLDNTVNIRFHNVRYLDTPIPETRLDCPVPAGYDVIRGKQR